VTQRQIQLDCWYERANSSVSSRHLNCNIDVEERTKRDRAFHVDAAVDWNDRSPTVERIVRGTIRSEDKAELRRWRWMPHYEEAVDKWRKRLRFRVSAEGEHFAHSWLRC